MKIQTRRVFFAFFILFTALVIVQSSCKYQVVTHMPWVKNKKQKTSPVIFYYQEFSTLIDSAKLNNIPIFIDFYTNWCAPCKVMDKEVFTDKEVSNILNKEFLNLKINSEKGEGITLRKQFNIKSYPTLIFINAQGKEVFRHEGLLTSFGFLKAAKKTIK